MEKENQKGSKKATGKDEMGRRTRKRKPIKLLSKKDLIRPSYAKEDGSRSNDSRYPQFSPTPHVHDPIKGEYQRCTTIFFDKSLFFSMSVYFINIFASV